MKLKEKLFLSFFSFFLIFVFLNSLIVSFLFTKNEQRALKEKYFSFTASTVYNINHQRKLYLKHFPIKFHSFISKLVREERSFENFEIVDVYFNLVYSYKDFFKKEKEMMFKLPLNYVRDVSSHVIENKKYLIVLVPVFEEDGSHRYSFIYYFDFFVLKRVFSKSFFVILLINIPLFILLLAFVNRRVKKITKSIENLLSYVEGKREKNFLKNMVNSGTYEIRRLSTSLSEMTQEIEKSFKREQEIRRFLESVLNSSPKGIFIVDKNLKIMFKSKVFVEKYEKNKGLLWEIFERFPLIKKNEVLKLEGRTYNISSYNVEGGFKVIIIDDITSEIELQQKLIIAQKMESLGFFIAGIVHDIKNMLGVVAGYVEILEEEASSEFSIYVENIKEALKETQGIIYNFLKFSRANEEERKIYLIDEIILETLELISARLTKIDLREEIKTKNAYCKCNKEKMVQVLINIFLNAIEAIEKSEEKIIWLKVEDFFLDEDSPVLKKGRYIMISVRDNGPGISDDVKNKIFEPFFTTKEKGTGLGLFSSYIIVQNEDGFLEVKSEENKGAEFIVYIPRVE